MGMVKSGAVILLLSTFPVGTVRLRLQGPQCARLNRLSMLTFSVGSQEGGAPAYLYSVRTYTSSRENGVRDIIFPDQNVTALRKSNIALGRKENTIRPSRTKKCGI